MGFVLGKLTWFFFMPANLFCLLLIGFVCLGMSHKKATQRRALDGCAFLAFLLFFVGAFPIGDWMLAPLENRFPTETPDRVDGIIILGGDEHPVLTDYRKQATLGISARRYIMFANLARRFPSAKLVFSGGSPIETLPGGSTNASVAKSILQEIGLDPILVSYDDESRTTYENAMASTAMIKPKADQNWLLVTSAFHMPRAIACFRKAGWNVYAAPADYQSPGIYSFKPDFELARHLMQMQTALHEYIGLVAYKLLGKVDTIWPASH